MIPFNKNIPLVQTKKNVSQADLLNNNLALNYTFGFDHYPFSDSTANVGKHNKVTQVVSVNGIPKTEDDCKIFANTATTNTELLQYSKAPDNIYPPTPLTTIQSSTKPVEIESGETVPIYDFQGLTRAIAIFYAYESVSSSSNLMCESIIFWYKNTFVRLNTSPDLGSFDLTASPNLTPAYSKTIFQLTNDSDETLNIFWTIKFLRIEI